MKPQIDVQPPTSDARRERVERKVFEQLAAVRTIERTDAILAVRPARARWFVAGGLIAAAAAVIVIWLGFGRGGDAPQVATAAPSRVVTPVGGTSRFTIGEDAVIDAGGDTSVEVQHDKDGGITLALARGSVDCDVAPRAGRAPFRVIAGEVSVEVVGTRFTVTRTPSARVDVARGKVRVTAPGGTWLVAAGESWTPSVTAAVTATATDTATVTDTATATVTDTATATATVTAKKPKRALGASELYTRVLDGKDPAIILRNADEYLRRFPKGLEVEEMMFHRVEALTKLGRVSEGRRAANEYLKQFPSGTYREPIARLAAQK